MIKLLQRNHKQTHLYGETESHSRLARLTVSISLLFLLFMPGSVLQAQDASADLPTVLQTKAQFDKELDKWMLQAYEGDRDAQFKVGVLFTNDEFITPDYEQSVYWYKQAARQGHVLAQYNLGHQYLTGTGVNRSETTAMSWWLKAAAQDHPLAQFNIGRAYYLGIGLEKDESQSRYWFERAALNKEPKSIEIMYQLGWAEPGQFSTEEEVAEESTPTPAQPTEKAHASNETSEPEVIVTERAEPVATKPEPTESKPIPEPEEPVAESKVPVIVVAEDIRPDSVEPESNASESEAKEEEPVAIETVPVVVQDLEEAEAIAIIEQTESSEPGWEVAQEAVGQNSDEGSEPLEPDNSIAIYTNPAVRKILIAIEDIRDQLNVVSRGDDWTEITSRKGFPVWVHNNYIVVADDIGTISGEAVNARSVPIIAKGSVVGRLNKDETLQVLDKRNDWYRVQSPDRFRGWVRTVELESAPALIPASSSGASSSGKDAPQQKSTANGLNDNEWLFSQPAENYTLQLASFDDPQKIAEFMSRKKFERNPNLHRFTAKGKDQDIEWTYFLYGSYQDADTARDTREKIGQKLAWIRSFGKLQENRCVAWKRQIPTSKNLNKYCVQ